MIMKQLGMALEVVVAVLFVAGTGGGGRGGRGEAGDGGGGGGGGGMLLSAGASRPNRRVRLHNFDDFLENYEAENRILRTKMIQTLSRTSDDEDLQLDAGSGSDITSSARRNLYRYSNADPSKSCCHLGHLAGESGFHCHSHVYIARYRVRIANKLPLSRKYYNNNNNNNKNGHNESKNNHNSNKSGIRGGDRRAQGSNTWTNQRPINPVLYNFQSCVSRRPQEFHRCCYVAKIRRRQMYRYHRHRRLNHGINTANNPLVNYFY